MITSIGLASHGLLDAGTNTALHTATLGYIRSSDAVRGGDGFGSSGGRRKWWRNRFRNEVFGSVEEALKALVTATEKKPTKRWRKKAREKVLKIAADSPEPAFRASIIGAAGAISTLDPVDAQKAADQLKYILAAERAFAERDKRQQEAVLALLLSM